MKKFRYGNVLRLGTLQFDGHVHDYFVKNSKKLVVYYILPRGGEIKNFIAVYKNGKLFVKKNVYSPKNIVAAYLNYYFQYLKILFKYFSKSEKIYFLNTLPVFFFFNSILRQLRNLEIIYWVQDFWPMNVPSIKFFRWFMYYYHKRLKYTIYVSDRINKVMNSGKLLNQENKHTVMLGINPPKIEKRKLKNSITLCFIGVIVESQGVDLLLSTVAKNKNLNLRIIGTGREELVQKYKKLITTLELENRVYFPNKFIYGNELSKEIKNCHAGIVLYEENKNTVTYFADPAKIKQYAEFGLPVIMTRVSEIADYIERFKAGIIVQRNEKSVSKAISEMMESYPDYLEGIKRFNKYFDYKSYYAKAFRFLEK